MFAADSAPVEAPKPTVRQLVADLDSDDFQRREQATEQLARAGSEAVDVVVRSIFQGSPEARWRALVVLARMSIAADERSADVAHAALEKLAASSDETIARSAQGALERFREIRHQRAVESVRRLGGQLQQADFTQVQRMGFLLPQAGGAIQGRSLRLDEGWTGGDDGLRYVADLEDLTYIELADAPLTEAALQHFLKMPKLQHLQVNFGKISGAAWRAFRKQRPEVSIFAVGEGLLGVYGDESPRGLEVHRLFAGSSAEKAGVKEGDIITSLNGHPLTDIQSLTLCVFDKKRGYPVTMEVLRGDEKLTLKGELGSRADAEN